MKYLRSAFALLLIIALASCGGGEEKQLIGIDKSSVELQGTWSIWNQQPIRDKFVVTHASGLKAFVTDPEALKGKIIVSTMEAQSTQTIFLVTANIDALEAGENRFRIDVQLFDNSNNLVATKPLDIIVQMKDSLVLSNRNTTNSTIAALYNKEQKYSSLEIGIYTSKLAYQISDSNDLLKLSKQSGVGADSVILTYKPQLNKVGEHKTDLIVTTNDKSITKSLPVTVIIDKPRWSFQHQGLLFSKLADSAYLTTTTKLLTTSNMPPNTFSASSSVSWLQVSIVNNELTAIADPRGLKTGIHFAEITVKSADIAEKPEQSIFVQFYVNSDISKNQRPIDIRKNSNLYFIPDYAGAYIITVNENSIELINIFTGQNEKTINYRTNNLNPHSRISPISKDGRYIQLAKDNGVEIQLVRYDLLNNVWLEPEKLAKGAIYEFDLVEIAVDGFYDIKVKDNHKNIFFSGDRLVPKLEITSILDQNRLLEFKPVEVDGILKHYEYTIVEAEIHKSLGVFYYTRVLSRGTIDSNWYHSDRLGNGIVAMKYNTEFRLYEFGNDGSLTTHVLPDESKGGHVMCAIDKDLFYLVTRNNTLTSEIEVKKINKFGQILAKQTQFLDSQINLSSCEVALGNQMLILNIDGYYEKARIISPL